MITVLSVSTAGNFLSGKRQGGGKRKRGSWEGQQAGIFKARLG